MVATSSFSVDRFVRAIWWESELADIPSELTSHALEEFQNWPQGHENWPTLITFYRALRTIDRARHADDKPLLKLVTDAYSRLEEAQPNKDKPDETGATRWLLFKLECLGRLSAAGLAFVGNNNCSEAEPPNVRKARQQMREKFSAIQKEFEEGLKAVRSTVEQHLRSEV
jgi:hypothetical protein